MNKSEMTKELDDFRHKKGILECSDGMIVVNAAALVFWEIKNECSSIHICCDPENFDILVNKYGYTADNYNGNECRKYINIDNIYIFRGKCNMRTDPEYIRSLFHGINIQTASSIMMEKLARGFARDLKAVDKIRKHIDRCVAECSSEEEYNEV